MRLRQIKFDKVLFTTDNARVWNNQMSPYWPNEFGGQNHNPDRAISQTWRDEIGERAFAAYFTEVIVGKSHYVDTILNSSETYQIEEN